MIKYFALPVLLIALLSAGFVYYRQHDKPASPAPQASKPAERILYWYDPMYPEQHFDKPGKSPYMDMALVPKLAGGKRASQSVMIMSATRQSLGMRLARVERMSFSTEIEVSGQIGFDERNTAIVQARADGFVTRVYGLAAGDIIHKGDPVVELTVPAWVDAENEFLAARSDPSLKQIALERMQLAGIPEADMRQIERSGKPESGFIVRAPLTGVIQSIDIRQGMNTTSGQTLVRINGLNTVWLEAAVPQFQSGSIRSGDPVTAEVLPGQILTGTVELVLPVMNDATRSVTVRVPLSNPGLILRPGTSARVIIRHAAHHMVLVVPTEALIRTGRRTLVMVAGPHGTFTPVEVSTGRESNGQTEILAGLHDQQNIVVSGQFLIDSEASLADIRPRPLPQAPSSRPADPAADNHMSMVMP